MRTSRASSSLRTRSNERWEDDPDPMKHAIQLDAVGTPYAVQIAKV
jgi:hypothetical protein